MEISSDGVYNKQNDYFKIKVSIKFNLIKIYSFPFWQIRWNLFWWLKFVNQTFINNKRQIWLWDNQLLKGKARVIFEIFQTLIVPPKFPCIMFVINIGASNVWGFSKILKLRRQAKNEVKIVTWKSCN